MNTWQFALMAAVLAAAFGLAAVYGRRAGDEPRDTRLLLATAAVAAAVSIGLLVVQEAA